MPAKAGTQPSLVILAKAGTQPNKELTQRRKAEIFGKIAPLRILGFNQLQLPSAVPFLDPLLPRDRAFHRRMLFEPDEQLHTIFARKAANEPIAVLVRSEDVV